MATAAVSPKTRDISIISQLKKIALTSLELGREIAREKARNALASFQETRAGQTMQSWRERFENRFRQSSADNSTQHAPSGKRRLGRQKYSAKTARLSHV